jgi:hypothetical protein
MGLKILGLRFLLVHHDWWGCKLIIEVEYIPVNHEKFLARSRRFGIRKKVLGIGDFSQEGLRARLI